MDGGKLSPCVKVNQQLKNAIILGPKSKRASAKNRSSFLIINLTQQVQHVFVGDFFNGTVAVVFALQVFDQRFVILYAMDIIRRVTDTVEVAAETDVVVIAQKVQHIIDMAVHTVDAGIVIIFFQELSGKGDTDQTVIGIDGFDLVVIEIRG